MNQIIKSKEKSTSYLWHSDRLFSLEKREMWQAGSDILSDDFSFNTSQISFNLGKSLYEKSIKFCLSD